SLLWENWINFQHRPRNYTEITCVTYWMIWGRPKILKSIWKTMWSPEPWSLITEPFTGLPSLFPFIRNLRLHRNKSPTPKIFVRLRRKQKHKRIKKLHFPCFYDWSWLEFSYL